MEGARLKKFNLSGGFCKFRKIEKTKNYRIHQLQMSAISPAGAQNLAAGQNFGDLGYKRERGERKRMMRGIRFTAYPWRGCTIAAEINSEKRRRLLFSRRRFRRGANAWDVIFGAGA
jgi:hypothetical protein